jgi:hypothetical protein
MIASLVSGTLLWLAELLAARAHRPTLFTPPRIN